MASSRPTLLQTAAVTDDWLVRVIALARRVGPGEAQRALAGLWSELSAANHAVWTAYLDDPERPLRDPDLAARGLARAEVGLRRLEQTLSTAPVPEQTEQTERIRHDPL